MNCLLDTCVFLWLALEPTRLSKRAVEAINNVEGKNLAVPVKGLVYAT